MFAHQAFVGDKYGKTNLPLSFVNDDFNAMTKALQDINCDVTRLQRWYWLDENDEAKQYFLRPISDVLGKRVTSVQKRVHVMNV